MKFNTYLAFNGNCREALQFYAQLFGGKITAMMSFGESPARDEVPAAAHAAIMHGCVEMDGGTLMGTDATPDHPYPGVQGAHVVINVDEAVEAERLFAALSQGGRVDMPIGKTFWAERYGMTVDRFGVPWMVNCSPAPGCAA